MSTWSMLSLWSTAVSVWCDGGVPSGVCSLFASAIPSPLCQLSGQKASVVNVMGI